MKKSVSVIDYGAGNLLSVGRAFEHCGADVSFVTDASQISHADYLVLPGVGAFCDGMRGLKAAGMDSAVRDHAKSGKPLLGICLGMQMLASESLEFGSHEGLDLVQGRVIAVPTKDVNGNSHKVPFVGWADLEPRGRADFGGTPLCGARPGDAVYLVHSYHCVLEDPNYILAVYDYGGQKITAAIGKDNVTGCQFHPEKSGEVGLRIITDFLKF